MLQEPDYTCTFTDPSSITDPDDVCTAENICDDDPRIASWDIDWSSNVSLHNWNQKLDLMCKPEWLTGSLGSVFFVGFVCTTLWLPRLADTIGRRKIFLIGVSVQTILFTSIAFTKQFYVMLATIFLFGGISAIGWMVSFVYFLELMPEKWHTLACCVWSIADSLVYTVDVFYFWFFSN